MANDFRTSLFQFLEKLSKAKQIQYHKETNEIQLTKEGQLFLKEHHFSLLDYPAIDLYRFGRSDRESWQLIQFAVQVTSYLSFEENSIFHFYQHRFRNYI